MSCGGARLRVLSTGGPRSDDPTRLVRARAHHRDGFHFPVPVLTPAEARGLRRRLEAVEAEHGGALRGEIRHKPHLLFTWLAELVRHPTILDAVEDVLGPNLLVWSTSFFIKEARERRGPRVAARRAWRPRTPPRRRGRGCARAPTPAPAVPVR